MGTESGKFTALPVYVAGGYYKATVEAYAFSPCKWCATGPKSVRSAPLLGEVGKSGDRSSAAEVADAVDSGDHFGGIDRFYVWY